LRTSTERDLQKKIHASSSSFVETVMASRLGDIITS